MKSMPTRKGNTKNSSQEINFPAIYVQSSSWLPASDRSPLYRCHSSERRSSLLKIHRADLRRSPKTFNFLVLASARCTGIENINFILNELYCRIMLFIACATLKFSRLKKINIPHNRAEPTLTKLNSFRLHRGNFFCNPFYIIQLPTDTPRPN